jgi:hypothetical protein
MTVKALAKYTAGEVDIVQLGTTTHAYAGGSTSGASSIDGNFGTAYSHDTGNTYPSAATVNISSTHTFAAPHDITKIAFRVLASGNNFGDSSSTDCAIYLDYSTNGTDWTNIWSTSQSIGEDGSISLDSASTYPSPYEISTGWSNVLAVRIRAFANSTSSGGDGNVCTAQGYCYEIQAYSTAYTDIGLRYRNAGTTYTIGAETLTASHKLRVRKDNSTYGIPLVDTTDGSASPIRISI